MKQIQKEKIIFTLFLIINIIMSLNCVTFFMFKKALHDKDRGRVEYIEDPVKNESFNKVNSVNYNPSSEKEPFFHIYTVENNQPKCFQLYDRPNNYYFTNDYFANNLLPCDQAIKGKEILLIKAIRFEGFYYFDSSKKLDYILYYNERQMDSIFIYKIEKSNSEELVYKLERKGSSDTFDTITEIEDPTEIKNTLNFLRKNKWKEQNANSVLHIETSSESSPLRYHAFYQSNNSRNDVLRWDAKFHKVNYSPLISSFYFLPFTLPYDIITAPIGIPLGLILLAMGF